VDPTVQADGLPSGKDPGPAQRTALEVLAANGAQTVIQRDDGVTPTPVISRALLVYNRGRKEQPADGPRAPRPKTAASSASRHAGRPDPQD
jgi:hypothetical protein